MTYTDTASFTAAIPGAAPPLPPLGMQDPLANPDGANAAIASALASPGPKMPKIDMPPSGHVDLVAGLVLEDGVSVVCTATVRELTGEHEERLARAGLAGKAAGREARFFDALLECGVEKIGDAPATRETLDRLLLGDAEQLILAVREMTYGPDLEFIGFQCPHCDGKTDMVLPISSIPRRTLDDPVADRYFTVDLRRGRKASVRLPTVADQRALLSDTTRSGAEANTVLLSRCVVSISQPDGMVDQVSGRGTGPVREGLSIPDRASIIAALTERRPGPLLSQLTTVHEECGQEVALPVSLADLF